MVVEFFRAFSSAPLAPRQYLENFGATLGASWTGRALVYNFRRTVLIFALNRYFFCYNSLNYGQQYGGGDNQVQNRTRFCVQTDSRAGFNDSSIHGFLTIFVYPVLI